MRSVREQGSMINFGTQCGSQKESSKAKQYVSSRPGLRRRILTQKDGYKGRLDEQCGEVDLKTITSDHRNHH